jgi:TetR/AcrR family transcriptional repressor of bet genes
VANRTAPQPRQRRSARLATGRRDRASYERTHTAIIEATIDSIVKLGLCGTTVQTIADEAGVSTATVIKHFKTKEGVLDAVIESLALEFETARRRVTAEAGGDPVKCFNLLLDISFHPEISSDRRIGAWYAYSGEVTSRGFFEKHMRATDRAIFLQVRSLCRELAESGGNPAIDPDAVAIGFVGALEWLWEERLLGRRKVQPTWAKKVMQAYLAGAFPNHFTMPERRGRDESPHE